MIGISDFIDRHWAELLISIVSALFGLLTGAIFYWLQKRQSQSASHERRERALDELRDILEANIVNKLPVSFSIVEHLIEAASREYIVELRQICTPISLLEDVQWRLRKSRHLDVAQKAQLGTDIIEHLDQWTAEPPSMPASNRLLFELRAIEQRSREVGLSVLAGLLGTLAAAGATLLSLPLGLAEEQELLGVLAIVASLVILGTTVLIERHRSRGLRLIKSDDA